MNQELKQKLIQSIKNGIGKDNQEFVIKEKNNYFVFSNRESNDLNKYAFWINGDKTNKKILSPQELVKWIENNL